MISGKKKIMIYIFTIQMACNLLLKKSLMELNQSSINPWHLSIKDVPLRTLNYLQSFELDKI